MQTRNFQRAGRADRHDQSTASPANGIRPSEAITRRCPVELELHCVGPNCMGWRWLSRRYGYCAVAGSIEPGILSASNEHKLCIYGTSMCYQEECMGWRRAKWQGNYCGFAHQGRMRSTIGYRVMSIEPAKCIFKDWSNCRMQECMAWVAVNGSGYCMMAGPAITIQIDEEVSEPDELLYCVHIDLVNNYRPVCEADRCAGWRWYNRGECGLVGEPVADEDAEVTIEVIGVSSDKAKSSMGCWQMNHKYCVASGCMAWREKLRRGGFCQMAGSVLYKTHLPFKFGFSEEDAKNRFCIQSDTGYCVASDCLAWRPILDMDRKVTGYGYCGCHYPQAVSYHRFVY